MMKTDYQNLTAFETAAVCMVVLGLALIGMQFWVVMPEQSKADIVDALQVLDMRGAWETQLAVNGLVLDGMEAFLNEFALAAADLFAPIGADVRFAERELKVAYGSFLKFSDALASNYQVNYVQPGVEAGMGGKVLGAYLERLSEQVVPVR